MQRCYCGLVGLFTPSGTVLSLSCSAVTGDHYSSDLVSYTIFNELASIPGRKKGRNSQLFFSRPGIEAIDVYAYDEQYVPLYQPVSHRELMTQPLKLSQCCQGDHVHTNVKGA